VCRVDLWTTKNHQTSLECGNMVLVPSHTTSGETLVHALWAIGRLGGTSAYNFFEGGGVKPLDSHGYLRVEFSTS